MPTLRTPLFHVRPVRGWLNDPNGVVRHGDRWHVFYQHNPRRAAHGDIAWAHVSSADLLTWAEHPIAFSPSPGAPDEGGCWSGTALPWLDVPAVVYTGIVDGPERSTVCLRRALDADLDTWSEPVVVAREPPHAGVRAMRDPYPFEWRGRRFALLGAGMADGTAGVLLFSCDDPLDWRYEGVWLDARHELVARAAPADFWECPQLVRFGAPSSVDPDEPDRVVLVLSLQVERRLDGVAHVVADLQADPVSGLPRLSPRSAGRFDDGPDLYAPHVVQDAAGPLVFGWIREADAPDDAPQDAVAGCLTFPRRLAWEDGRVVVSPDPALNALLGPEVVVPPDRLAGRRLTLPERARAGVRTPVRTALVSGDVRVDLGPGPCDVWVDGPVAEVFRPAAVATTVRSTGAEPWCLHGDLSGARVTVRELVWPQR